MFYYILKLKLNLLENNRWKININFTRVSYLIKINVVYTLTFDNI